MAPLSGSSGAQGAGSGEEGRIAEPASSGGYARRRRRCRPDDQLGPEPHAPCPRRLPRAAAAVPARRRRRRRRRRPNPRFHSLLNRGGGRLMAKPLGATYLPGDNDPLAEGGGSAHAEPAMAVTYFSGPQRVPTASGQNGGAQPRLAQASATQCARTRQRAPGAAGRRDVIATRRQQDVTGKLGDPEKRSGSGAALLRGINHRNLTCSVLGPQANILKMTTPNKTPPGADPKQLERTGTVREIGSQAVWSLSSCKPGFGVDQLRDDNLETYWQSDGSQPHLVNIQFRRKTTVKTLCIYADYKSDESYTPSKISVRVGNNFHNLQEIRQLELVEPSGWIHVPLTDNHKKPTRTFMIQIAVLANHQNGRDTHMRQIKIYTPVEESSIGKFPRCTTIDFMMYRSIR